MSKFKSNATLALGLAGTLAACTGSVDGDRVTGGSVGGTGAGTSASVGSGGTGGSCAYDQTEKVPAVALSCVYFDPQKGELGTVAAYPYKTGEGYPITDVSASDCNSPATGTLKINPGDTIIIDKVTGNSLSSFLPPREEMYCTGNEVLPFCVKSDGTISKLGVSLDPPNAQLAFDPSFVDCGPDATLAALCCLQGTDPKTAGEGYPQSDTVYIDPNAQVTGITLNCPASAPNGTWINHAGSTDYACNVDPSAEASPSDGPMTITLPDGRTLSASVGGTFTMMYNSGFDTANNPTQLASTPGQPFPFHLQLTVPAGVSITGVEAKNNM